MQAQSNPQSGFFFHSFHYVSRASLAKLHYNVSLFIGVMSLVHKIVYSLLQNVDS